MNEPMPWEEARELCKLRLTEDGITAGVAVREFMQLTHLDLRDAAPIYREFRNMEKKK